MVRALLTAAVLFVWAAPLSGCVTGEPSSVFIVGNGRVDDDCIIQQDVFWTIGIADVDAVSSYLVNPVVWNQLRRRSNHIGADPNGVHIQSAEVSIQTLGGATLFGPFDVPTSGFIPSAQDADSHGVGQVSVPVPVSPELPHGQVQLSVRLFGQTNGQLDVSTGEWLYVFHVCHGCLRCAPDEEASGCLWGQDGMCY
jgi:hypothetical protein